jgi:diguanylate cyclase (GGDEF)-like protein/PAS domain S-box-containing protein
VSDDLEFYRRVVECTPAALMIVDGEARVTFANRVAEEMFGYSFEEVRGRSILEFIDVDWNPIAVESVMSAMASGGLKHPMIFKVIANDGTPMIAEVTANSLLDDPHVGGLLAYIRPWDEQWLLDQVLEALARDDPPASTLALLTEVMSRGLLDADGAIFHDPGPFGFTKVVASPALGGRQSAVPSPPDMPWEVARIRREAVCADVADLGDEDLRREAQERGHVACWAWPVAVDQGGDREAIGCVVLWRRNEESIHDESVAMTLGRLGRLSGLVLERARVADGLRHAATHDPLTGLVNRARFFELVEQALVVSDESSMAPVGVLYIDLDRFKAVNDEHGHGAGDRVLVAAASRSEAVLGVRGALARLGGDEFAIVVQGVHGEDELAEMATQIVSVMAAPIDVGVAAATVGASIGVALVRPGECSADALVDAADRALLKAKRAGKGTWRDATVT